jgi:hypothetical protein
MDDSLVMAEVQCSEKWCNMLMKEDVGMDCSDIIALVIYWNWGKVCMKEDMGLDEIVIFVIICCF